MISHVCRGCREGPAFAALPGVRCHCGEAPHPTDGQPGHGKLQPLPASDLPRVCPFHSIHPLHFLRRLQHLLLHISQPPVHLTICPSIHLSASSRSGLLEQRSWKESRGLPDSTWSLRQETPPRASCRDGQEEACRLCKGP